MKLSELVAAENTPEVGQKIIDLVNELPGRITRGDMMLGILSVEEVNLAPAALKKAHQCGISNALLHIGNWLTSPPVGEPDFAGAEQAFNEAVAADIAGAKLRLAEFYWFYRREDASEADRRKVLEMVRDQVSKDDIDGQAEYLLGMMTNAGFGTPPDATQALAMIERAGAKGNANAMFEAFVYYESGNGTAKNPVVAREYLRKAAEKGHSRAMYNLGALLATGRGFKKDLAEAAKWYEKASDAGNVRATVTLAMMYASGDGVPKDTGRATELFDLAECDGADVEEIRKSVGL